MSFGNSASINYANNLVTNQILQQQFNNTVAKNNNQIQQNNQASSQLGGALDNLSNLLNSSSSSSKVQLNAVDQYTLNRLQTNGADKAKLENLVDLVSGNTDDLLYTRTTSNDPNITAKNKVGVYGADLSKLLGQAARVAQRGDNVNAYLDTAAEIVEKGDYDDLRRFLNVTDTVMGSNQKLDSYYTFAKDILNKRSYDFESNVFSLQTLLAYGTNMDTGTKIMKNMETTGMTGRNNLVDLNRVVVNEKQKTGSYNLAGFLDKMAASGDTRAFLDKYMADNGLKTTAPDFTKFNRIERIDGEDMIIKEGESAALFGQAVSQQNGLLSKDVMYWSSLQTGAMSHGDNYLDLSKLKAGTYDIYVKIGNYAGGTDTAKKRVVVLPKDEVSVEGGGKVEDKDDDCDDGKVKDKDCNEGEVKGSHDKSKEKDDDNKVKSNNGLGDQKDDDNEVKGTDTSNPGHNKVEFKKDNSNEAESDSKKAEDKRPVLTQQSYSEVEKNKSKESEKDDDFISSIIRPTKEKEKRKDFKLHDLSGLCEKPEVKPQIIRAVTEDNKELSERHRNKRLHIAEVLADVRFKKEHEKIGKCIRSCFSKDETTEYLSSKNINNDGIKKCLDFLKYNEPKQEESSSVNPVRR
ncbi:MAG: hypothetical protein AABZ74_11735 [Cyanobacteriota bacterium]